MNKEESTDTFVVRLNYDVSGTIVQLPDALHDKMREIVSAEDAKLDIDLNCYNNDDYLFIAGLFYHAHNVYRKMGIDPVTGKWIDGCRDIPHVVIYLQEQPVIVTDENQHPVLDDNGMFIPDDRKLNAGVSRPFEHNGVPYYQFGFNRYILQRFILFLQEVFDKNEELVISLGESEIRFGDGTTGTAADVFPRFDMITKDQMFKKAQDLWSSGYIDLGYALMREAAHMADDEKVPEPILSFWDNPETGKTKLLGFSYVDQQKQNFYIPIRKRIYNTSAFYPYFLRRNTLITELFEEAIRMIVYHEFFHIANGHGLLLAADEPYAKRKDIAVCAEQNADDSAIRMMVCELLWDTKDGHPASGQLKYTRGELIHKWSIRIFAAYLAMSWMYRGDDRIWSEKTLEQYEQNQNAEHPLYQFRTFNILNCAFSRMEDIGKPIEAPMTTAEGLPIDASVVQHVIRATQNFLDSFEASFRITYDDTRTMEEKIMESWKAEQKSLPPVPEEVPFLMNVLSKRAAEEAEKIRQTWPELKERLIEVGAYNQRFTAI